MQADRKQELVNTMELLFAHSSVVVSLFDQHDMLIYGNQTYRELTRLGADELLSWSDIIRRNHQAADGLNIEAEDVELWLARANERRWRLPYREFEIDLAGGRWIQMTETLIPDVGMLGVGVEITSSKATVSSLRQDYLRAMVEAETDPLTGLGNRRALERLTALLETAGHRKGVSALMLDIDDFKSYNDLYGHLAGDQCLKRVADIIVSSLRDEGDYPLRIGGEEFLVLLHATSVHEAMRIAERIRNRLTEAALPHSGASGGLVSISVGVAEAMQVDVGSVERLIGQADRALYRAKQAGRNQVRGPEDDD